MLRVKSKQNLHRYAIKASSLNFRQVQVTDFKEDPHIYLYIYAYIHQNLSLSEWQRRLIYILPRRLRVSWCQSPAKQNIYNAAKRDVAGPNEMDRAPRTKDAKIMPEG